MTEVTGILFGLAGLAIGYVLGMVSTLRYERHAEQLLAKAEQLLAKAERVVAECRQEIRESESEP